MGNASMLSSGAAGGPLVGATIHAPQNWNGVVKYPGRRGTQSAIPYPGRYAWVDGTWTWLADEREQ